MVTEEKERLKALGLKKPANSFKMIRAFFCSPDDESSILKLSDPPPEKTSVVPRHPSSQTLQRKKETNTPQGHRHPDHADMDALANGEDTCRYHRGCVRTR
eukprot:918339-Amphidinium_carterae.2